MKYILRKLTTLIITLFIVSLLAFLAFQVIPGSPASTMLGTNATPEAVAELEAELGLDDPVLIRYGRWVSDFVRGDWGTSYSYNMPVKDMVMEKLPATAALVLMAFGITVAASFPLGILAAKREGSWLDKFITVFNQICMSIPPVFVGILLCFLFGITLRVFVPGNFVTFHDSPGKFFLYMLFPALAVALSRIAMTVKMLRSSILDEMNKDYIRTAFSRGRTRADALKHHALRNAIIPRHRLPGCDGGGTGRGKHRRRAGLHRARRGPSAPGVDRQPGFPGGAGGGRAAGGLGRGRELYRGRAVSVYGPQNSDSISDPITTQRGGKERASSKRALVQP